MKKLIEYFIKYPVSANILILMIVFLGYLGMTQINSTLMPQVDPGLIQISAAYPGASPEEIENGVILKIENGLEGISGIKRIRSTSAENAGIVTVELISGADPNIVLQDVKNAVDAINSFPSGLEPPTTKKVEWVASAIEFSLSGNMDLSSLKTISQKVEDDLLAISGISKVSISGFPDEEIEIAFKKDVLKAYGLTLSAAAKAVSSANIDLTGGQIKGTQEDLYIRARQKKYYAADLKNIIIKANDKEIIRLGDIADVRSQWSDEPDRVYVNSEPAVMVIVKHTADEDIIGIVHSVKTYLETLPQKYSGIQAHITKDNSQSIASMKEILLQNGLMGFGLVILFLSLFLNKRLAFWVAISIPLSFLGMFAIAIMAGITMNRISMFGMIIVVGILVDDGIVIAENIYQHYERGAKPVRAAIDGTLEVLPAVVSGVLTTIIAFGSILFVDGMFGQIFKEMGMVVISALAISLIEAALILPAHIAHSKALKQPVTDNQNIFTRVLEWFRDKVYGKSLTFVINHRLITISIVTGLFLITIGAINGGIIRMNESSAENTNYANVNLVMPAGTPENQTMSVLDRLEVAAKTASTEFSRREGKEVTLFIIRHLESSISGSVTVSLIDAEERHFTSTELLSKIHDIMGEVPEARQLEYAEESYFGKPVEISLLGANLDELSAARDELTGSLKELAGLRDVNDNSENGNREISIELKDKAYQLGLNIQDIMSQIRNSFYGYEVQRLNRGKDEIKVWVRYEEADRTSIGDLQNMYISSPDGMQYPLSSVADFKYDQSTLAINHKYGKREVTVTAGLTNASVDITSIRRDINTRILSQILVNHPSVTAAMGGHVERQTELLGNILVILPIMIILLFTVIAFTFRSSLQAFLIIGMIPLSIIGIAWGHAIHGQAIDMPSYLGIVALIGIMVNDSIVFIENMNDRLREGAKLVDAIWNAGISRFRPIVLTSITTMAGLAPLIVTNSEAARMVVPMAISVAYGVFTSTLITLFVLPIALTLINQVRRLFIRLTTGKIVTPESIEQAVRELAVNEMI